MAESSAEYIQHHLTNLTYGQLPDGSWGFAETGQQASEMGFYAIHVDSMFWSILLADLFPQSPKIHLEAAHRSD